MRQANFIQFIEEVDDDIGYCPTPIRVYKVLDLDDTLYYDDIDDDGENFENSVDAIRIDSGKRTSRGNIIERLVHNDSNLDYNLITITTDDDCEFFRR